MAGPFDSYEVQFSQPLSKIDTNQYTQALFSKKAQYDQGYQQAQNLIDHYAGLPVAGAANKQYLQKTVEDLTTDINNLKPDFSNVQTMQSIKSLSNRIASDSTIQNAISATAAIQENKKFSNESIKKVGTRTANDDYLDHKIAQWDKMPAGTPFKDKYIPFFDKDRAIMDKLKEANPGTIIEQRPNGKYEMWTEEGWKGLSNEQIDNVVTSTIATDPRFAQQMSIDAWSIYSSYTPDDLSKKINNIYKDTEINYQNQISNYQLALAASTGSEKEQLEKQLKLKSNEYNDIVNSKTSLINKAFSGKEEDWTYATNNLYNLDWRNGLYSIFGMKSTGKKAIENPELDNIETRIDIAKKRKELEQLSSKSTGTGGVNQPTGTYLPQPIDTAREGNAYSIIDQRIQETNKTIVDDCMAAGYAALAKEGLVDKFFNTPTDVYDHATGMKLKTTYSLKPGKAAEFDKAYDDWFRKYLNGESLTPQLQAHFDQIHNTQLENMALRQAKQSVEQAFNNYASGDPELRDSNRKLESLQIPTLTYNGYSISKNDLLNAALAGLEIKDAQKEHEQSLNDRDPQSAGLRNSRKYQSLDVARPVLKKYGLSEDKLNSIAALSQQIAIGNVPGISKDTISALAVLGSEKRKAFDKKRNDFYQQQARNKLNAENSNEFIIDTSKDSDNQYWTQVVDKIRQQYEQTGGSSFSSELNNILESKGKINVSYRQSGDTPEINVSSPENNETTGWLPITPETAKSLNLYKQEPEWRFAEKILSLKRTGDNISTTGKSFEDALQYGKVMKDNTPFLVKYHIHQSPNGYSLVLYNKVFGTNLPPNQIEVPQMFSTIEDLYNYMDNQVKGKTKESTDVLTGVDLKDFR